jgi:hypothetical protein
MRRLLGLALLASLGCSEEVGGGEGGAGGAPPPASYDTVVIPVTAEAATYVSLAGPQIVEVADAESSSAWDLAFRGWEIFTNSGLSGPASGGAFGPLGVPDFDEPRPPVPFVIEDETAGAFWRWWAYDGNGHLIYSRYHVYGVRQAGRHWKVQILGYYGEDQGAPVTALYRLRYAEVTEQGSTETTTLLDLDGTAGGVVDPPPTAPSGCLDLRTGTVALLSLADAALSPDWQICFRRDNISVNGEMGGPGGVEAVDVDRASLLKDETIDEVKTRTADSELARFDAASWATLTDPKLVYAGDRITSAFATRWFDSASTPPTPSDTSWYVLAAGGVDEHMVLFESFSAPDAASPGEITARVRLLAPY